MIHQGHCCRKPSRRGNAVVEYVVVLGLIVVACLGSLQILGINVQEIMRLAAEVLNNGGSNAPPVGSGPLEDPRQAD